MEAAMRRSLVLGAGLWLAAVTGAGAEPPRKADTPLSAAPRAVGTTAQAQSLPPVAPQPALTTVPVGSGVSGADLILGTGAGCDYPCPVGPSCQPPCGPPGRIWAAAEALWWFANGSDVPPLVTTSPPGTPRQSAGVLAAPGTVVLVGGDEFNDDFFPGVRFTAGAWLNRCQTIGIEGSFLWLFDDSEIETLSSPGEPILARPFTNASTGQPDAELIAFPGLLSGSVAVASTFALQGADAALRCNLCCSQPDPCGGCGPQNGWRVDALAGFRYLRLHEDLAIAEDLTVNGQTGLVPGTRFVVSDLFRTENRFYGGQVGLAGQVRRGRLWLDVTGKLGIGATHQVVSVGGSTTTAVPGAAAEPRPGGLLALGSNGGRFVTDEFTLVPELGVRLGCQVWGCLRAFVGYDLLYWSEVARPGEQIDLTVNPTQLPPGRLVGPARPAPTGQTSDLFLQGLSAGVELRW
jgi:Putative beta barrel porin-7 (BBP7)